MINSDDNILAKHVVLEHKGAKEKDSFYETVENMTKTLGIDMESIDEMSKAQLKKNVKMGIEKRMTQIVKKQLHATKLRFVTKMEEFKRKVYIEKMDATSAIQVLRTRLNMLPIYGNYKGNISLPRPCPLCKMTDDTTEHLVTCKEVENDNLSEKDLMNDDNIELWHQINNVISHNMEKRNFTPKS